MRRAALEKVFRDERRRLYGLARALVREHHAAEDVVQDAALRFLKGAAGYTERGKLRAYLVRAVYTAALDWLRARKRERTMTETGSTVADAGASGEETLIAAVRSLPPEQRDVLLLRCYSSLTFAEAAEVLGVPLGTVLSRMRYGLEKLRRSAAVKEER